MKNGLEICLWLNFVKEHVYGHTDIGIVWIWFSQKNVTYLVLGGVNFTFLWTLTICFLAHLLLCNRYEKLKAHSRPSNCHKLKNFSSNIQKGIQYGWKHTRAMSVLRQVVTNCQVCTNIQRSIFWNITSLTPKKSRNSRCVHFLSRWPSCPPAR